MSRSGAAVVQGGQQYAKAREHQHLQPVDCAPPQHIGVRAHVDGSMSVVGLGFAVCRSYLHELQMTKRSLSKLTVCTKNFTGLEFVVGRIHHIVKGGTAVCVS